jgi:hypothetical protein
MSASTTLKTVWINLASDLSQYQSFSYMSALKVQTDQPGEVRRYAGGRMRIVRRANTVARLITCTLPQCTRAQIAWLETNVGQLMCFRDDRGRKVWAAYLSMPVDENQYNTDGNITLALSEVTHTDVA